MRLVEQDAHQFGDGEAGCVSLSWMAALSGSVRQSVVRRAEPADDVGERTGDEEIFLHETEPAALRGVSRPDRERASRLRRRALRRSAATKSPRLNS